MSVTAEHGIQYYRVGRRGRQWGTWLSYLAAGIVVLSPWLLAAVEEWAALLLVVALLGCGGLVVLVGPARAGRICGELRVAGWFALLVVLWLVIQVLPLPAEILRHLSPEAYRLQEQAAGALLGETAQDVVLPRISLAPPDTVLCIGVFLAGWVTCMIGLWASRSERRMQRILSALLLSAVLQVLVAMIQSLGPEGMIYGFYRPYQGGRVLGTFTNRNHFASYITLVLGAGLGLVALCHERLSLGAGGGIQRHKCARPSLLAGAVTILVLGIVFSLSRGGLMGMAVCVAVFWCLMPRRQCGHWLRVGAGAVLAGLGLGIWAVGGRLMDRFVWLQGRVPDLSGIVRLAALRDAWRMFVRFWVTGCGAGAFQHVFPAYSSSEVAIGRWTHLHNDLLEWLCESGIVGMTLSAGIVIALLILLFRGWPSLVQGERWLCAGLSGSIIGVVVHSLVDYNLHRVTHWLAAALFLGMIAGMAARARQRLASESSRKWRAAPVLEGIVKGVAFIVLALGLWCVMSGIAAELIGARVWQLTDNRRDLSSPWEKDWAVVAVMQDLEELARSRCPTANDALDAAWCALQWVGEWDVEPEKRIEAARLACELAARSAARAPSDYECWLWLSRAHRVAGRREAAERYLLLARLLAPEGVVIVE